MNKSILITGASGGIGSEIAAKASQQGYKVGLLDLNKEKLAELESEIPNSTALPTDVTDEEEATELMEACIHEPLKSIKGAVSAEHGIGLEKKKLSRNI